MKHLIDAREPITLADIDQAMADGSLMAAPLGAPPPSSHAGWERPPEIAHEEPWPPARTVHHDAYLPAPPQTPALAPGRVGPRHEGEGEGRAFHGLNHADTENVPGRDTPPGDSHGCTRHASSTPGRGRELDFVRAWNESVFALADADPRRRGYGRTNTEARRGRP